VRLARARRRLTLRGLVALRPTGFVRLPMVPSAVPRLVHRSNGMLFLVVREDRVFPDIGRFGLSIVDYVPRLDGRASIRLTRRWRGCAADGTGVELPF